MRNLKWAAPILLLSLVAGAVGARLIERSAGSNAGSPVGWLLLAAGIAGVLLAIGVAAGAFNE